MAKTSKIVKSKRPPKYRVQQHNRCAAVWSSPRVYPYVWVVQDLLQEACAGGASSRSQEIELVIIFEGLT